MSTGPDWIRDALSTQRFAPYLAKTGGDVSAAIAWYWWNVDVSAAFYAPLHCLEVTLRNALHRRMATACGRSDWWAAAPLMPSGQQTVADARHKLTTRGRAGTADAMVAELSFGFWVSLVSGSYHRSLWERGLYKAFPLFRGPRRALHADLLTMLLFRNRIMHHEPIHHRHLEADHQTALRVVGYISPDMLQQLKQYDCVPVVLGRRPYRRPQA
jgi:hypothetical protein